MKIVGAEVFVTCPGRNFVTLKITTEDGITGLGDATLNGRELSVASYLTDHLCPQLIGRDAHRIPDSIVDHHAVMVEPFTIAANVTGQVNPTEQDVALIYGAGPMGLTTVQALKGVYQVKTVIVVDRIEERLAMAKQSGADWTLNNGQHSLAEFLQQKALKPTLIVDAACHPAILQEAITLASPAARIVLMGFSSDPCEIVQQGITGKELAIYSSRLNANKFPVVIDWLSKGLIDPDKLITHTFDYQHVTDAIELFEKDQRQCCKVLLTFAK